MDQSRVDQFNSLVRGVVTLALPFGVVYGFIVSKVVRVAADIGIFGAVSAWWFASRTTSSRSTDRPNGPSPPTSPTP